MGRVQLCIAGNLVNVELFQSYHILGNTKQAAPHIVNKTL